MKLATVVNDISEKLFGYREASEAEILERIDVLVQHEKDIDAGLMAQGRKFRMLVEQLSEAIEEFDADQMEP